jgi:hypothetical protein
MACPYIMRFLIEKAIPLFECSLNQKGLWREINTGLDGS